MSLPYFPMYPTDFEADTSHLTLAEDGAYNRLLRLCWMTSGCNIPADEAWIMRRMKARTKEEKQAVNDVLAEFFAIKKGRYCNARLMKEWREAKSSHSKRVLAGKRGGTAKALNAKEKASSNAKAMLYQPEPEPEPLKREAKASQKRASRLPQQWTLPKDWGEWALLEGWPEPVVRLEAEKFRDYWIGVGGKNGAKLDWQATWRNWMRNSKSPKAINGGLNEPTSTNTQLDTISDAARARRTSSKNRH